MLLITVVIVHSNFKAVKIKNYGNENTFSIRSLFDIRNTYINPSHEMGDEVIP